MNDQTVAVSVDRDFARIGSKSYAINKINSMEVQARRLATGAGMVIWGFIAFVCVLATLGGGGAVSVILAAICGLIALYSWFKWRSVEYVLLFTTSSQEISALKSPDKGFVNDFRTRIEAAIARQSD